MFRQDHFIVPDLKKGVFAFIRLSIHTAWNYILCIFSWNSWISTKFCTRKFAGLQYYHLWIFAHSHNVTVYCCGRGFVKVITQNSVLLWVIARVFWNMTACLFLLFETFGSSHTAPRWHKDFDESFAKSVQNILRVNSLPLGEILFVQKKIRQMKYFLISGLLIMNIDEFGSLGGLRYWIISSHLVGTDIILQQSV